MGIERQGRRKSMEKIAEGMVEEIERGRGDRKGVREREREGGRIGRGRLINTAKTEERLRYAIPT